MIWSNMEGSCSHGHKKRSFFLPATLLHQIRKTGSKKLAGNSWITYRCKLVEKQVAENTPDEYSSEDTVFFQSSTVLFL